MKVLEGIDGLRSLPPGGALSIGNFDGVHLGHRRILELGRELRTRAGAGSSLAVVTFEPHPLTVLRPEMTPPRLTPPGLKQELLESLGVDYYVVLAPKPEVLNLTAERFWKILRDDARPAHLIEGTTFNFGKGRGGDVQRLREWSAGTGVQVHVVEPLSVPLVDMQIVPVSSTTIRWLLDNGRVRDAAICLARPYALEGTVVTGNQRGRTIGVPTANLDCGEQMVPGDGVYAGRCAIDGATYPAAISIGSLPTFDGDRRQVEAHLIGFTGDLYGRTLRVDVLDWIRDQQKFAGIEALKAQIARDIDRCVQRQAIVPERPLAHTVSV